MPSSTPSDDDLNDISPHVRIRIDPAKKYDWMVYADEHDLSLTDLIKEGVDNTINDTWILAGEANDDNQTSSVDVDTSKLENGIQEIVNRLEAVETQLDDVMLGSVGDNTDEQLSRMELMDLASRCHDKLPKVHDEEQLKQMTTETVTPRKSELPLLTGVAHDIAMSLDEKEYHVRQALSLLEREQNANVSSIIQDGIRRWYELNPTIDSKTDTEDAEDHPINFVSGTEYEQ